MTIDARDYGWPLCYPVPIQRCPKSNDLSALLSAPPQPTGKDLAQAIFWGLEYKGIVLSEKRREMIIKACEEPE